MHISSSCYFILLITFKNVVNKNTCELLPIPRGNTDKIENNETKLCRYRDEGLLPYEIFRYRSGEGCYSYFPAQWFTNRIKVVRFKWLHKGYNCNFPVGRHNGTTLLFDYKNDIYSQLISTSFKQPKYFQNWKTCAINAEICCNFTMDQYNIHPSTKYPCPTVWDAWSCFNMTTSGSIAQNVCPEYTSSSRETPCTLYSEKECFSNGTWNVTTNYIPCATAPVYRKRHTFHVICLYISILLSTPAVIIFLSYRKLRTLRVNLHRNLLIACLVRNALTIITKKMVILDALKPSNETNYVLEGNGVSCRILAYFNSVATNAIYACMLADGFYLHKVIVRIFSEDPNVYILHGVTAILSFLPTTVWVIIVAIENNQLCWVADSDWSQWIPDGFRIAILSTNMLLLADIIRVLLMKLRRNVNPQHTKSTLKAMSFLIPLFGIPFILTASRNIIDNRSCTAGDVYYYISYILQSFQSVMVAILFCYCNKEVQQQVKRTYKIMAIMCNERFPSTKRKSESCRRDTAATYIQSQQNHHEQNITNPTIDVNLKVDAWVTENNLDCNNLQAENRVNFGGVHELINNSSEHSDAINESSLSVTRRVGNDNKSIKCIGSNTKICSNK